jgi:hypothetical protein
MIEAQNLWSKIKAQAAIDVDLTFVRDSSLPIGAYKIHGPLVVHCSTDDEPGAVYAVARIAAEMGFAMHQPGVITRESVKPFTDWKIDYVPQYDILHLDNKVPGKLKPWFHWHHVPTVPLDESYHRSWWIQFPHRYPKIASGVTRCNILHEQFPIIVYQDWLERRKPETVSLFEVDGTGYAWAANVISTPAGLNAFEKECWDKTIAIGARTDKPLGTRVSRAGKVMYYTQRAADAINSLPYNDNSDRPKVNYTDLYVRAYKAIEACFHAHGERPRFRVLAYACYFKAPAFVNMSGFDVHYVSPGAGAWTRELMEADLLNWQAWKLTGAKMIWRPNLWLNNNLPDMGLVTEFIKRARPDGLVCATNYRAELNSSLYAIFKALQGLFQ